jgi:hypothetical protein
MMHRHRHGRRKREAGDTTLIAVMGLSFLAGALVLGLQNQVGNTNSEAQVNNLRGFAGKGAMSALAIADRLMTNQGSGPAFFPDPYISDTMPAFRNTNVVTPNGWSSSGPNQLTVLTENPLILTKPVMSTVYSGAALPQGSALTSQMTFSNPQFDLAHGHPYYISSVDVDSVTKEADPNGRKTSVTKSLHARLGLPPPPTPTCTLTASISPGSTVTDGTSVTVNLLGSGVVATAALADNNGHGPDLLLTNPALSPANRVTSQNVPLGSFTLPLTYNVNSLGTYNYPYMTTYTTVFGSITGVADSSASPPSAATAAQQPPAPARCSIRFTVITPMTCKSCPAGWFVPDENPPPHPPGGIGCCNQPGPGCLEAYFMPPSCSGPNETVIGIRGSAGCFDLDTPILMANGEHMPAGDVRADDLVWNPALKQVTRIASVVRGPEPFPLIKIRSAAGEVAVTEGHPVATRAGVKLAKDVTKEDQVLGEDGAFHQVELAAPMPVEEGQEVVNFTFDRAGDARDDELMLGSGGLVTGNLTMQERLVRKAQGE